MNTLFNGFSNFSTRFVYSIYAIFAAILIINFISGFNNDYYLISLMGFLFLLTAGTFILIKVSGYLQKISEKKSFMVLMIVCLVVKATWILLYKIQPLVDYATFYYSAEKFSNHFMINSRYIALFPHIFGYSWFLSNLFKIFGAHFMVPPIINVVLSTISMALIYLICKKIDSIKTAIIASILWIFFPSQTIYNMFVLSEPLYSTVLLLIWLLIILSYGKIHNISEKKLIFYSVLLGLLLTFMNVVRPIAAIPIIALAIWLFIINIDNDKRIFVKKIAGIAMVLLSYYLLSFAANHYISVRLGEKIASTPGYNVYVGFNTKSYGTWNLEDAQLLFHYSDKKGWSADDAQRQMLKLAKQRIESGNINFPNLFFHKFLTFLGADDAAVAYARSALDHYTRYLIISNIYYYFLIAASLFGVLVAFKDKNKSPVFFICLFIIGLTVAHMLVEVATRYHYSLTISMVILAAIGINQFSKRKKSDIHMNEKKLGS